MFWNNSQKEKIALLEKEVEKLKLRQYREGDKVYISDGKRDPLKPYYLISSYNAGTCYYISQVEALSGVTLGSNDGVHINDISHERPETCKCCGQLLD